MATQNIYSGVLGSYAYISASLSGYSDTAIADMSTGSVAMQRPDVVSNLLSITDYGFNGLWAAFTGSRPDVVSNLLSMTDYGYMGPNTYLIHSYSAAGGGGVTAQIKYKMRGYRPATSAFEYWITANPNAAPPSGNTLIDITVAQTLDPSK